MNFPRPGRAVVLGQVISLITTLTGVCSQLLATRYAVAIPTAQSFANYVFLAIIYCIVLAKQKILWTTLKQKTKYYLLLALIDVEANYLVVKAYQYTNITSVMLLDCFTIPCTLVLTYFVLRTKYNWRHGVGVLLCLLGLGVLVYSDAVLNETKSDDSNRNPVFGDILCLIGALLYSVSNVGQEYFVTNSTMFEYLGMIGVWGSLISGLQLAIFERHELATIKWSPIIGGLIGSFVLSMFAMYSLVPIMLLWGGAAFFNLSLLTSDVYAILFGVFLFHKVPSPFYFAAFGIIIGGLLLYNIKNEPQFNRPHSEVLPESQTLTSNTVDLNVQNTESDIVEIQRES
jgi:solute carrier family 35 protein F1/2